MLKIVATLLRGRAAAAEEALADAHALPLLDQQVREAAAALDHARHALALAMAGDAREGARLDALDARHADLEARAMAALAGGREDLAAEAAEALADLEAERAAGIAARATFAAEASRTRAAVRDAERRLAEVERGRRVARAAESVRRLRGGPVTAPGDGPLREAERTLARLRERQAEEAAVETARDALDAEARPASLAERLGAAGFGPKSRPTGADVLARLKARAADATPPSPAAA